METTRNAAAGSRTHAMRWVVRLAMMVSLPVMPGACVMAPGMRMSAPASVTVSSGEPGQAAAQRTLPVQEIDVDLLQRQRQASGSVAGDNLARLAGAPRDYTIGPGDVLQITVWDHPELASAAGATVGATRPSDPVNGFVVDQKGNIEFPYAGQLHVDGLSPDTARTRVADALSAAYRNPQVTLRVASFRAKSVYVEGEVKAPGLLPVNDVPMTLLEAISRAGGFTADADQSHLTLVRRGVSYPLSLPDLFDRALDPASVVLQTGDLLRVAGRADNGVFVMGEVTHPTIAVPMKTGRLSISQALAQAGSINSNTADANELYVVRGIATDNPQVFHLNAGSPVAMTLANEFQLASNDVLYVDGNGLVRFSRVLSLLLPSYNAGMAAALMAK